MKNSPFAEKGLFFKKIKTESLHRCRKGSGPPPFNKGG